MRINDQLKLQLMGRMPMMPRFRLPVSQEYAESCLAMAVAAEVESAPKLMPCSARTMPTSASALNSRYPDGDFEQCVRQTAAWTVNASPRHSLLLAGRYGNGKTTFLRALQSLVNAFDLRDPMTGKRMRMPLYNAVALTEMHRTSVAEWHNVARAPLLAIDDLGTEPREVMEFGNMTAPMRDLLEIRYDRSLPTLISTNMTPADITKRYGDRIGDRMREVMEVVRFRNGSYRR